MRPGTNQHHSGGAPTRPVNPRATRSTSAARPVASSAVIPRPHEVLRAHSLGSLPASLALTLAMSDCRDKSRTAPRARTTRKGTPRDTASRTASGSSNSPRTERGTSSHAAEDARVEPPQVHADQRVRTEGVQSRRPGLLVNVDQPAIRVGLEHGELRDAFGREAALLDQRGPLEGGDARAVQRDEIAERLGRIQVVGS